MASDHQVALSRSHLRLPPATTTNASKQTRQAVPAFLQKLYEMVNDLRNADLIRWSDAGDSFFVLDHERFAREVLGRWFKHQNFSSFVRQLNMYGFHKIPHLQQGVLRSDTETEFWNFAHASFHRGQPDLLYLIQRKKQSSQQQMQMQQQVEEVAAAAAAAAAAGLVTDVNGNSVIGVGAPGTSANAIAGGAGASNAAAGALGASGAGSTGIASLNNSQLLDIHSIVQGIAAITRHQAAISAELSELKRSNELLWQDALMAREKHQKQEDTINRIVKFLAGVFGKHAPPGAGGVGDGGHHGGGHHGEEDGNPGTNVSVQRRGGAGGGHHQQDMHHEGNDGMGVLTRRRARLMIEDGRRQAKSVPPRAKPGVNVVEVTEESDDDSMMADSTALGIGGEVQPTSPVTLNLNSGPDPAGASRRVHDSLDYPRIEMEVETPKSANTPLPPSPAETIMGSNEQKDTNTGATLNPERALTHTPPVFPSQQQDNSAFQFDPRTLMINLTPAQIQQLLTSLATQNIPDPSSNSNTSADHANYEGGFLTSVGSDRGSTTPKNEGRTIAQPNSTPPFDISSYLLPSPLLANLSIGAGASGTAATSPAPTTSAAATPSASPLLSNSTPRASGASENGAYRPGAASAPAGMQGYGPYPPPVVANSGSSNTASGANGNASAGYPAYTFPYNADAGWGNVGSGTPSAGGAAGGDYAGLFSPLMQGTPRVGYSATTGASTNGGQNQNPDAGAVGAYNSTAAPGSGSGSVGQPVPNLATLSSSWQAAEDIDRDVNAMNISIHSLIQMLGLDPSLVDTVEHAGEQADNEEGGAQGATEPRRRKNSVIDYDNFVSTWGGRGGEGPNGSGAGGHAKTASSDSASSSTPSGTSVAGSGSHPGSVTSEAPDGLGDGDGADGMDGGNESANPPFAAGKVPLSSARPQSAQSVASSGPGAVLVDDGVPRPINKKARTGLTASAATSTGLPTTVVEAGGRKRRSAIVDTTAVGADELDGVEEQGGAAPQVQTRGAVASGKGAKSKKRRG
ncbi:hypothetical protein AX14_000572 [Amanita brunnescens Koide BX004]|nr:hypothetical protein AX14_000572 [Amanita brunnescens Koide BX004]